MRHFAALAIVGLITMSATLPARAESHPGLTIPASIQDEHHELHEALARATRLKGQTGKAAQAVEAALAPHFEREEEFALPPLGLLPQLSQGKVPADSRDALAMTDKLKRELPRMLKEHQAIVGKLEQLEQAATREKQPEVVRFAHQLKAHARTEEEILYPTSLLIGEYLHQQPRR